MTTHTLATIIRKHEIWLKVSKTETINFYIGQHNSNLYIYTKVVPACTCISGYQIKFTIFLHPWIKFSRGQDKTFLMTSTELFLSKESKFSKTNALLTEPAQWYPYKCN